MLSNPKASIDVNASSSSSTLDLAGFSITSGGGGGGNSSVGVLTSAIDGGYTFAGFAFTGGGTFWRGFAAGCRTDMRTLKQISWTILKDNNIKCYTTKKGSAITTWSNYIILL